MSRGSLREIADLSDYQARISSDDDFLRMVPSYTSIRDPLRRLCHRLIAVSISGRGQAPKKPSTYLDTLRGKHRDRWSGEHFVRCLTEHFGYLGLGSARSREAAGCYCWSLEDVEGTHAKVDEGVQAILAPVQAPQPHPATYASEFTVWAARGISQLLDTVGATYMRYFKTHVPYQRRKRHLSYVLYTFNTIISRIGRYGVSVPALHKKPQRPIHHFETDYLVIVYNDASTSIPNVSSEPTDSFSYKLIPVNDLKLEPVNDHVEINTELCSENIDIKSMDNMAGLPPYALRHLWLRGKHGDRWSGEHFVRCLAEHFGLATKEGLHGLIMVVSELKIIDMDELVRLRICERLGDTWAWVVLRPERQQSIARLKEEVHEIRKSLDEHRVVVDMMAKDFSRLSSGAKVIENQGADDALSNGGSLRVIVYGYDGLLMQPVAPPSLDYVLGPEYPLTLDYVPGPEHPPSPIEIPYVPEPEYPEYLEPSKEEAPIKDQPLPADATPIAASPGYVTDFDPEEDPEEDHADYPVDRGDGDDYLSDDDDDDTDDEDEEPFEDEEEDKE
nr:hypothetical protein [Tanacetum cinerariifolium]